jgi:hypothetical protein
MEHRFKRTRKDTVTDGKVLMSIGMEHSQSTTVFFYKVCFPFAEILS